MPNNIHPTVMDFSTAAPQQNFSLIPAGTIVKVMMTIQPGNYADKDKGWTTEYVSEGRSGAKFLKGEFEVLTGEFQGRKIWSLIGLYSPKGPTYEEMGRTFMRSLLESARNILPADQSPEANIKRRAEGFKSLTGIPFLVEVGMGSKQDGSDKNEIKRVITPSYPRYSELMGLGNTSVAAELQDDGIPF